MGFARTSVTIATFALAVCAGMVGTAQSGEVRGTMDSCDLSSYGECEWSAHNCYKPTKPIFFVTDVESYNMAVEAFNRYLSGTAIDGV